MLFILLIIELLDELVDGVRGAAWPLIRNDLHLTYLQIGLLLTIPNTLSSLIEPIIGIWADIGQRRPLILSGGIAFAIALLLLSLSHNFTLLLVGFILFYPASGCFVSLSQAVLMDLDPNRHEQNMARWVFAGSLGNVLGPLLLAGAIALNHTWRSAFFALAICSSLAVSYFWKQFFPEAISHPPQVTHSWQQWRAGMEQAIAALQRSSVLRWLILLQFSDLMLDVFGSFLALYFVDVVGTGNTQASFAVMLWLVLGLLGDFLLIPLLEKMQGLRYLQLSVYLVLGLYPAFLLVPNLTIKLILLGCLGMLNAGWYSILQGQLYTAMPGQSGTVMTLSNLVGLVGGLLPLGLGAIAQGLGLQSTMWILLVGPIALWLGLLSLKPRTGLL